MASPSPRAWRNEKHPAGRWYFDQAAAWCVLFGAATWPSTFTCGCWSRSADMFALASIGHQYAQQARSAKRWRCSPRDALKPGDAEAHFDRFLLQESGNDEAASAPFRHALEAILTMNGRMMLATPRSRTPPRDAVASLKRNIRPQPMSPYGGTARAGPARSGAPRGNEKILDHSRHVRAECCPELVCETGLRTEFCRKQPPVSFFIRRGAPCGLYSVGAFRIQRTRLYTPKIAPPRTGARMGTAQQKRERTAARTGVADSWS